MTDTEYTEIAWTDVQPGDILVHENGDRLSVLGFESVHIRTTAGLNTLGKYRDSGFTPHREAEPVPTEPGAYYDRDGDYWLLDRAGDWYDWSSLREPNPRGVRPNAPAPFTRLVPMPTEERIESAILSEVRGSDRSDVAMRATAAVMSLLSGEANSTEVES